MSTLPKSSGSRTSVPRTSSSRSAPQKPHGLPKIVRFVLKNSLIGAVIGWSIAAGLIWFNINGLGQMFHNTDSKLAVIFILGLSFGSTFAFAYLTTAVLLLPTDKDEFDKV